MSAKKHKRRGKRSRLTTSAQVHSSASAQIAESVVSPKQVSVKGSTVDSQQIFEFTKDVLDKRYNIYGWCETKVYNLITLNGLILAAIFVVVGFSARQPIDTWLALGQYLSTAGAILFLCASLLQALRHIRPKMNSGTGTGKNPRSVVGTITHECWEDFELHLRQMDLEKMISSNAEQIYGMSFNIIRNDLAIRGAAAFSILGMLCFLTAVMLTFYANSQQ